MHPLPVDAQLAPVNGILTMDVNGDSWTDVLLVGNDFGNEVLLEGTMRLQVLRF